MASICQLPVGGLLALRRPRSGRKSGSPQSSLHEKHAFLGQGLLRHAIFLTGSRRLVKQVPGAGHTVSAVLEWAAMADLFTGFISGSVPAGVGAAVEALQTEVVRQGGTQGVVSAATGGALLPYWIGGPLALWYFTAPPGSAAGLLDLAVSSFNKNLYRDFDPLCISVGKTLGEGSFGIVYEGWVADEPLSNNGAVPKDATHVVLKRVKKQVSGAEEMREAELYMNRRLQRSAPGACAEFLGTTTVTNMTQRGKLTEGLWLVWKYQGEKTLDFYLKQRNFPANIAGKVLGETKALVRGSSIDDVAKRDCAVIREVLVQLLTGLRDVHKTGVVHRDVKPLNLVFSEEDQKFKLIDLGACVDLRTGHNYVPDETVMDPIYCAPEQYVMPTNMPSPPVAPLMTLLSPLVWAAHTPDRFDLYSAGLVLLQMACPSMRQDNRLAHFNSAMAREGYDLDRWRKKRCPFPDSEFVLLDADGGAGWDLLRQLLQERSPVPLVGKNRPSAAAALNHRFFRNNLQWQTAEEPKGSGSSKESGKSSKESGKSSKESGKSGSQGRQAKPNDPQVQPALASSRVPRSSKKKVIETPEQKPPEPGPSWTNVFGYLRKEALEEVGVEEPVTEPKDSRWFKLNKKAVQKTEIERVRDLKKVLGAVGTAAKKANGSGQKKQEEQEKQKAGLSWTQLWIDTFTGATARAAEEVPVTSSNQLTSFSWTQAMIDMLRTQKQTEPEEEEAPALTEQPQQGFFGLFKRETSKESEVIEEPKGSDKKVKGFATSEGKKKGLKGTKEVQVKQTKTRKATVEADRTWSNTVAAGVVMASAYGVATAMRASVEVGYSSGKAMAQPVLLLAAAAFSYFYVARPVVSQLLKPPAKRPKVRPPEQAAVAQPQAAQKPAGSGTNRSKKGKRVPPSVSTGLVTAVSEMEAQLAHLEVVITEGREFNQQQRALLAKMEKLLLPPPEESGVIATLERPLGGTKGSK